MIGGTDDIEVMKALNVESKEKGAFLRLPYQVGCMVFYSFQGRQRTPRVGTNKGVQVLASNHSGPTPVTRTTPTHHVQHAHATCVRAQERYKSLTRKTHVFLGTVLRMYHPSYILKADDDIYLQLDRLPMLVPQLMQMQKGACCWRVHCSGLLVWGCGGAACGVEQQESALGGVPGRGAQAGKHAFFARHALPPQKAAQLDAT